jgi:DNA-binding MarR family transcriptional regulator
VGLTGYGGLCKVRRMSASAPLQPTLWRTCRALANRTRLRILCHLNVNPNQTVTAVARALKTSELREVIGSSPRAVRRQLEKLVRRGFARQHAGKYERLIPRDPLGRALAQMAAELERGR